MSKPIETAPIETVPIETVVVARGKSIQVGDRIYLPGETAPVPAADVAHMKAGGFVHDPDQDAIPRTIPRTEANPSGIGLQQTTEIR